MEKEKCAVHFDEVDGESKMLSFQEVTQQFNQIHVEQSAT